VLDDIIILSIFHDALEYRFKELGNASVRQRDGKEIHYSWCQYRQQYPTRLPLTDLVSQASKLVVRLLDAIGTGSKNDRHDHVRGEPISVTTADV